MPNAGLGRDRREWRSGQPAEGLAGEGASGSLATYAIGDVQGCAEALFSLLELVAFDRERDRLWFVGDLVNRGPDSLEVLRFVRDLGEHAVTVLGNHDLHLLAAAAGVRTPRAKDTFGDVLVAPDGDGLLEWLRTRPLLHHDGESGFAMVHAGIPPQWTVEEAGALAREVEEVLRGTADRAFYREMYGNEPRRWSPALPDSARHRFVVNALTRLRYVTCDGALEFRHAGPPGTQASGLVPWFEAPGRRSREARIVFGHWATLQIQAPVDPTHRVHHLDTGCVWGGTLSAMRLEDGRRFSVPGLERGDGR